jgi:hypothetical protein
MIGSRRIKDKELHNLYFTPNIIWVVKLRRMRWVEAHSTRGKIRSAYKVSAGKRKRKRELWTWS